MLPTLRSVVALGGTASYSDIDEKAIAEADITDDQLAVVYGESAKASGPKILHRIAWARSMLKRVGALEGAGHGVWASTPEGQRISQLPDSDAIAELENAVADAYEEMQPTAAALDAFRDRSLAGDPVQMTVRELIQMWGASRRRINVIARVNQSLHGANLTTDPDFAIGSLDSRVSIIAKTTDDQPTEAATTAIVPAVDGHESRSLVVGNIPSATGGIKAVNPDDDLAVAHSEMQAHDYSQLAVMETQYKLNGAISWESMAKALLVNPSATLADCIDPNPAVVRPDQPLLEAVPAVTKAGYVFVRDNNRIVGIITTADLTEQFTLLTRPFLLLGEIEIVIRMAIDSSFDPEDLLEALDPNDERAVHGAESLTLGEIQYFISDADHFDQLGWAADRRVFIQNLDVVRRIRNDVMHFSPDPIADSDLDLLHTFLEWVQGLYAQQISG